MVRRRGPGFLTGVLVGCVIGIAAAIVLSPQLNHQTRQLREASQRWRQGADDMAGRARLEAEVLFEQGRKLIDEQRTRLQEAIGQDKERTTREQAEGESKAE